MATKRRGGLGKGLDSLIPVKKAEQVPAPEKESGSRRHEKTVQSEENEYNNKEENQDIVTYVRTALIEPDREQPRKSFRKEELEELAASIKSKGVLEPLLVQKEDNHYTIIAGERRWRACQIAGLKEIPVIVRNYSRQERVEISLIENIQREDLNPIEEALAYQRLSDEFGLKQEDIARKVSKSRTAITNTLRLLKLAPKVQQLVIDDQLSMGHARTLIPVEDEQVQLMLAEKIISGNLSVREAEKLVKNLDRVKPETGRTTDEMDIYYRDFAWKMNQSLGMKVAIQPKSKGGGKVEIEFSNNDDLEKIMDRMIR